MFGWAKQEEVNDLIAREDYARAVAILEPELGEAPEDRRLRRLYADVLHLQGRTDDAILALTQLADDLAQEGRAAQSIAVLKRIDAIRPIPPEEEEKVAGLLSPARLEPSVEQTEETQTETASSLAEAAVAPAQTVLPPRTTRERAIESALFRDFRSEELVAVIRGLSLQKFEPGHIIVSEGEPGGGLFVVCSGRLRAFVRDREKRNAQIGELGEGDFFGEVSVLTGSPRSATITAITDVELLVLDRPNVDMIAEAHPRIREVLEEFYRKRTGTTLEAAIRGKNLKVSRKGRGRKKIDVKR